MSHHQIDRRKFSLMLAAAAGTLGSWTESGAAAENFPSKPIRIFVMFPAGGGADSLNRVIGEQLSRQLGQSVIVDNQPGGAGVIAVRALLNAEPDGHTILHTNTTIASLTPKLVANVPYSIDDLVPVAGLVETRYLLLAREDFPANNFKELIALAKKGADKLACGDWGPTSMTRVVSTMLNMRTDTKFSYIPYRGEAPLTTDLLGGQVPLGWVTLPSATEHVKSGKLKAFGIAAPTRSELVPGVPTFIELGLKDFTVSGWSGYFARKGTPVAIVNKLHAEVAKALKVPEVATRLQNLGLDRLLLSTDEFADLVKRENERLDEALELMAKDTKK